MWTGRPWWFQGPGLAVRGSPGEAWPSKGLLYSPAVWAISDFPTIKLKTFWGGSRKLLFR